MKKLLLLSALSIFQFCLTANAQYTLLNTDNCGDGMNGTVDIKTVSYKVNVAQDSIWFKFEACNTLGNDFGIILGIDTNLVPMDGPGMWEGLNQSMKYDYALFITGTLMTPGIYYVDKGTPGSTVTFPATVTRPDASTYIVRTKLSSIDQNKKFNVLVGGASFDASATGSVYDDAPNTGFLTINAATVATSVSEATITPVNVYPNPANETISMQLPTSINGELRVADITGKTVSMQKISGSLYTLNISELKPGIYSLLISDETGKIVNKGSFVKK